MLKPSQRKQSTFSDDKNINKEQTTNRRSDRCFREGSFHVSKVTRTKHPAALILLRVVSNQDYIIPPTTFNGILTLISIE